MAERRGTRCAEIRELSQEFSLRWTRDKYSSRRIVKETLGVASQKSDRVRAYAVFLALEKRIDERYGTVLKILFRYFAWKRETAALQKIRRALGVPAGVRAERAVERYSEEPHVGESASEGGGKTGREREKDRAEERQSAPADEREEELAAERAAEPPDREETEEKAEKEEPEREPRKEGAKRESRKAESRARLSEKKEEGREPAEREKRKEPAENSSPEREWKLREERLPLQSDSLAETLRAFPAGREKEVPIREAYYDRLVPERPAPAPRAESGRNDNREVREESPRTEKERLKEESLRPDDRFKEEKPRPSEERIKEEKPRVGLSEENRERIRARETFEKMDENELEAIRQAMQENLNREMEQAERRGEIYKMPISVKEALESEEEVSPQRTESRVSDPVPKNNR